MKRFLMGVGIGLGFGAIMAPRAGKETRERMRSGAYRWWNELRDKVEEAGAVLPAKSVVDALNSVSRTSFWPSTALAR